MQGNQSMGMLRSDSYPFIPLPHYPVSCPDLIVRLPRYPRYPATPEDSLCESS